MQNIFANVKTWFTFVLTIKQNNIMTTEQAQLAENEFYRISSYWWIGIIYIALETNGNKTLCQEKGSKKAPKWILTSQLSKTPKDRYDF